MAAAAVPTIDATPKPVKRAVTPKIVPGLASVISSDAVTAASELWVRGAVVTSLGGARRKTM